ncbi:DUF664 domain-containing protein [Allobranchiibius sp. CTAmp26]|uniref:mycothiol transferase n=1 Tax=Allobranchiibius sp. CTAmp26 TaxID=2815214 RepID=UPI001AA1BB59|nr:DUF664 domain-containing protein [Allobranchiibius sp. CTAmp26]MBO1753674.1 DUF664 domain-containing protein [Allobranchiibius sp. CTAmp26]
MTPAHDPHRDLLLDYLRAQRRHVLGIVDGLTEEQLRRTVLPSGWSCAGMLAHLASDIEDFWFTAVVAGEGQDYQNAPDVWDVPVDVPALRMVDRYRAAITRSDAVIARTPAHTPPGWWPGDLFGDWRMHDLGEVILHVIAETACHAGHLDAQREIIDGRQWMVLTD